MKKKEYIEFIILFVLILSINHLFISNILMFVKNNDNTIIGYPNNYKIDYRTENIVGNILHDSEIRIINENELKELMDNPFLVNLIKSFYPLKSTEKTNEFLKISGPTNINYVEPNYYNYDIIYMDVASGTLAFSTDGKNIIYTILLPNNYFQNNYIDEDDAGTVESASERIKKKLNDLGITEKFDFEITNIRKAYSSEYNIEYSNVYYIEDTKHNIKITYEYTNDVIYYLQVGFVK